MAAFSSVTHALFQARMWREYAQAWDGKPTSSGVGREWVRNILRTSREECLRRAREAVAAAKEMNGRGLP